MTIKELEQRIKRLEREMAVLNREAGHLAVGDCTVTTKAVLSDLIYDFAFGKKKRGKGRVSRAS